MAASGTYVPDPIATQEEPQSDEQKTKTVSTAKDRRMKSHKGRMHIVELGVILL